MEYVILATSFPGTRKLATQNPSLGAPHISLSPAELLRDRFCPCQVNMDKWTTHGQSKRGALRHSRCGDILGDGLCKHSTKRRTKPSISRLQKAAGATEPHQPPAHRRAAEALWGWQHLMCRPAGQWGSWPVSPDFDRKTNYFCGNQRSPAY